MRILITADPELPVPPKLYGGAERIVDSVVRGIAAKGHTVTLLAHKDSQVPCELVPYPGARSTSPSDTRAHMNLVAAHVRAGGYDLIHSFGRLAYLTPVISKRIPKIMSYGRWVSGRSVLLGTALSFGSLTFTACSKSMIQKVEKFGRWRVIYHGVPMETYDLNPSVPVDSPLIYLGRIEHGKGVHLAIEVAQKCRRRLVIAGNVVEEHRGYFETQIKPRLCQDSVEYVGAVDDTQKNTLLRNSSALLMPMLWAEPFGLVMAEALACGTPVIGLDRGSVPEIVEDGINGFVCKSTDEMATAVSRLAEIDRRVCRRRAELNFSSRVMVDHYEELYKELACR